MDPGRDVAKTIRRRDLKLKRLGKLTLSAGTLEVNDQLSRDGERRARTLVLLDERQRQVDSRGHSSRRVILAVANEECVRVHSQRRKLALEVLGRSPMRCHAATVE